jgi:hypothetical protein
MSFSVLPVISQAEVLSTVAGTHQVEVIEVTATAVGILKHLANGLFG